MEDKKLERFQVSYTEVARGSIFYQGLSAWMCAYEIEKIWSDHACNEPGLTDHILRKWKECETGGGNHDVLRWFNSLDLPNRKKVIDWYNKKVQL
jgi:hypothetical protein